MSYSQQQLRRWRRNIPLINLFFALRGANVYVPFLSALLIALQFGNGLTILFTAFGYFMAATPEILTGYYADRYRRQASMAIGASICALSMVLLASLGLAGPIWLTHTQAFVASFLLYVGQSLMTGADSALQYDSLRLTGQLHESEGKDSRARGFYGLAEAFSALLTAGVVLYGWNINLRLIMLVQATIFALAALVAFYMTETPRERHTLSLGRIMRICLTKPNIAAHICLQAAMGSLSAGLVWLTPLYFLAYSGLKIGSGDWGWVYSFVWGWYLASVMLYDVLKLRTWLRRLPYFGFGYCIVGAAICYLGVAVGPVAVGMVLIGGTYVVRATAIPIANKLLNDAVLNESSEALATITSVARTLLWSLTTVSFVVGFWLLRQTDSLRVVIAATGVIIVGFAALAFWWAVRRGILRRTA